MSRGFNPAAWATGQFPVEELVGPAKEESGCLAVLNLDFSPQKFWYLEGE